MKKLLLIGMICLLFLVLAETMPPIPGFVLIFAAAIWLVLILREETQKKKALTDRRVALHARFAIAVCHLSGLPLPTDLPAVLFLTEDQLILETETEQWVVPCEQLEKIYLINAEQIRHINDPQLCQLLKISNRSFVALREKLRRHDSGLRRKAVLFLVFRKEQEESAENVWVFIPSGRPSTIAALIRASDLREKSSIHLSRNRRPLH